MMRFALWAVLWLASAAALAQSTGTSFPTPNGQVAGSAAILVPCGSILNGQPVMCPPGQANGLQVVCTNCSPSAPVGASSNLVSGTIGSTNTFQTLLASNPSRRACMFQNQGTHIMYFSLATPPTLGTSFQLQSGDKFYCTGRSNVSVTDTLSVTGTANDAFVGAWQ
jgi:hypothetical protein